MPFTTRDRVRLAIGDTNAATQLFSDAEIDVYLTDRADTWLLAAADLCDVLAVRFARDYDFSTDGQSFKRSQQSEAYRLMADELRSQSITGALATVGFTKVDGYSDDLSAREGSGGAPASGRRSSGYFDPDLPH